MKRKTNLFYRAGEDSNFITFSNYGESLTGNSLATDWKLFPSKFLCFYIDFLDPKSEEYSDIDITDRKEAVIKFITAYYENKLAYLRDYYLFKKENVESKLLLLNYLLEALHLIQFTSYNSEDKTLILNEGVTISKIKTDNDTNKINLSFIGDITEQDYNGIYSDMIQVINGTDVANADLVFTSEDTLEKIPYIQFDLENQPDLSTKYLYGWSNNGVYTGISAYQNLNAITDDNSGILEGKHDYCLNSVFSKIVKQNKPYTDIKFNIMVPLYDIINISTNSSESYGSIEENNFIDLLDISDRYIKNVPLGIWFANTVITLERNDLTGYAPSWSLLLSSQFKPFPYSNKMPNEITQDNTKEAFATYSQVLIRQNRLTELIYNLNDRLANVENAITAINGKLNTVGSAYYTDNMQREIINFENQQQTLFKNFTDEIRKIIENNWKGYIA